MLDGYHDSEWDLALGAVRGYRWWHVVPRFEDGTLLTAEVSLIGNAGGEWQSSELVAKCSGQVYNGPMVMEEHRSPHPDCQCGIYADWKPYALTAETFSYEEFKGRMFGVIEGSGRTIIGTEGFRCENARIIAGVLTDGNKNRDILGVPLAGSLDELLEMCPIQVPDYVTANA